RKDLEDVIFGRKETVEFSPLEPLNRAAQRKNPLRAQLLGGNLTVLSSAIGTPHSLKAKGKIVFLEDTGERAYRLDRMLHQFSQSKALDGITAMVLGDFIGGEDKDGISRVWSFWKEYAQTVKYPIFRGIPAGHGTVQKTVPLGVTARIENRKGNFVLSSPSGA